MKNKTISLTIISIVIVHISILFIFEYPGPGKILNKGLIFSGLLFFSSILLAIFHKDQQNPIKRLEQLLRNRSGILGSAYPILVFIWPFIIYWQLVIPSIYSKTIYNDFIIWYFTYKNYLLAHLSQFKIPLWSAAEASGFSFFSSPLTQTFYFLNLPYAVFGRFKGGISILSYQIFTITGISLFALGLYFLLRELRITKFSSFLVSILIPISFKLIETARFPNAVHSAAWYPWILLILTRLSYSKSIKDALGGSLLFTLFTIFLITAGYPYFVYYLIFLIPPYLLILCIPSFREQLFSKKHPINWKLFIGSMISSGFLSLVLLSPYLLEMQQLLSQTTNRAGKELTWSTGEWATTIIDFIGSVIFPPAASSEGWIYFGIIGLLIIIFFLVSTLIRSNTRENLFSRPLSIFFLLWISFIVYLSCDGNNTPSNILWVFMWNNLPGFSSLRVWARISIILLPIISILFGFSIDYFDRFLKTKKYLWKSYIELILISLIALGIISFQYYYFKTETYSKYWTKTNGGDPRTFLYLSIISCLLLLGLVIYAYIKSNSRAYQFIPIYLIVMLFSIFDARGGQISQWIWSEDIIVSKLVHIYKINLDQLENNNFSSKRVNEGISIPLSGTNNTWASRISWHYQRYVDFLDETDGQIEHRDQLLGLTDGTRVYFTSRINYDKIEDYLDDSNKYNNEAKIEILEFSGDTIKIHIETTTSGYLSYIDNWDPDWRVYVNSDESKIQLLFGTFKSVYIPEGDQIVEFIYHPIYKLPH